LVGDRLAAAITPPDITHLAFAAPSGWRLQASHQLSRVDPQPLGKLEDVVQRDVPSATLDLTDKAPVQPTAVGQLLLTPAQLMPTGANALAKGLRRW
jgi:hypothetical protein